MIATYFYSNSNNTAKLYLNGLRTHFLPRPPIVVVSKYEYRLKYGEDFYTLARKIFGDGNEKNWYIIADCNPMKEPDDWQEGDIVYLPDVIVAGESAPQNLRETSNVASRTTGYAAY